MKAKHKSINALIAVLGASSYLEIGLGHGHNIKAIQCENKVGVDPEYLDPLTNEPTRDFTVFGTTSDEYFEKNADKFDVIFIDGDHNAEQVQKDIVNAWSRLNKGGAIILHDINPPTKEHQLIPRIQESWTGDAWRAWVGFKKVHDKIKVEYIDEKYGLGVIHKSGHKVNNVFIDSETTYEEIEADRSIITG